MLVKSKKPQVHITSQTSGPKQSFVSRYKGALLISLTAVGIFAILAVVFKERLVLEIFSWAGSKGYAEIQEEQRLRDALLEAPINYIASEPLPKLVLDVKFKHMQKIFKS